MPKAFFLEPGLLARCDGLWYEPGILIVVEPGDCVEIFATRDGSPGPCRARYNYRQLDAGQPPPGLSGDWRGRRRVIEPRRKPDPASPSAARRRPAWASVPAFA